MASSMKAVAAPGSVLVVWMCLAGITMAVGAPEPSEGQSVSVVAIAAGGAVSSGAAPMPAPPDSPPAGAPVAEAAAYDDPLIEDLADGSLDGHTLADAVLIASGVRDDATLTRYRQKLDAVVDTVVSRVRPWGSPERRARRLLAELHRVVLKRYQPEADRFVSLLDSGTYNCVSATLLYIIAARELGLNPYGAETPLHVFVVLDAPSRRVSIETTSPTGYDTRHDMLQFRSFVLANKYATAEELAQRGVENVFNEFHRLTQPVPAEKVLAMLYHNAGLRLLQAGDAVGAARNLVNAARIYPHLAYRSESLRTTLAWAVREQYDKGAYLESYQLSEVAMRLFPDRTTVKDRFVAVAGRLVEETAAQGGLAAAEQFEARSLALLTDEDSRRKLETLTAPAIARAALLSRQWASARAHAARFRAAYSDPIEAERFARWVEARADEGSGPEDPGQPEFVNEMRAALAAAPQQCVPEQLESVVTAVGALAGQGRYEEALAVGRLQRTNLGDEGSRAALDILLKAVARRQISSLLTLRRWHDAGQAAEEALSQWPDDANLKALHGRTIAASAAGTPPVVDDPAGRTEAGETGEQHQEP
jgi:hypothetical protein